MTTTTAIYLTENDHRRLVTLLDQAIGATDPRLRGDLRRLGSELRAASIVKPEEIPTDIVTLNSRVLIEDVADGEENVWDLVFPADANLAEQRLSVLSPLGTALLGARLGQTVAWENDKRSGQVRIKSILFQPEAAGRFDL